MANSIQLRPATGRWLVSWQLSRCAAKESGCEILLVVDAWATGQRGF